MATMYERMAQVPPTMAPGMEDIITNEPNGLWTEFFYGVSAPNRITRPSCVCTAITVLACIVSMHASTPHWVCLW